jgi:hypothetical protein
MINIDGPEYDDEYLLLECGAMVGGEIFFTNNTMIYI